MKRNYPFALDLPTNLNRKPTGPKVPLVGQVETKGETDFNNFSRVDAYAWLSPLAARYAVGTRVPYNKRQPRNGRLGNNIINAETAGEKRSRWLLLELKSSNPKSRDD